jgi:cholesterol transport system auxiliary component
VSGLGRDSRSARSAALLALLAAAATSGCTGLFHSTARPEQVYYLRPPPATAAAGATAGGADANAMAALVPPASLRVTHPLAVPGLDSPHIMLVQTDHRMNFYAGSRWPAPASDLIEALAVETLRASGAWASVEDTASPFPSDYVLETDVRRFEADYTGGGEAPVVQVVIDCLIGRGEGREVIASFSATGSTPAAANRLTEVVAAFEQSTGAALESLSRQAVQAVRDDPQRRARSANNPAAAGDRPSQ